jgi:hypothetical protein
MFFSEFRVKNSNKPRKGETITEIACLEQFDIHKTDQRTDDFVINEKSIRLLGIPEDYKVYFGGEKVGERVFGETYNLNKELYQQMIQYLQAHKVVL